jgi:NhaP-type Na+/H+ or K+/H+ antiporter
MSVYLFLSRAVLGFVLGLMFFKTKNIWVNIIAHFLNNAIAVFQVYVLTMNNKKIDVSKMDVKMDWWFGIVGVIALYYLFVFLKKYSEDNSMKIYVKEQAMVQGDLFGDR